MKRKLQKEASRIADEIVALVERTDGPVTLCRVQREVTGFAASEPPYWDVSRDQNGKRWVLWGQMSEAGRQALNNVINGKRVAVEVVSGLVYLIEGRVLDDEDWQPIMLLPARQANVSAKKCLLRVPKALLKPGQMFPSGKVLGARSLRKHPPGLHLRG
jgi:hypothetical protein